ncbi:Nif3-like dinuclear metal center hexameric protein [Paenibacillus sp. MAHUQ-63]|nr:MULTISPECIES: Nif3-like dinuclear metal center hexameric protein [Bacillales]MDD9266143.1 Nif3-like dinuclear metal center hexameric protein [Paenibacillus sp. MAHUQ-63]
MAVTIRIQDIVDHLIEPVGKLDVTVDTLKFGDPSAEVKGIATAFMPTYEVIRQAIARGANLLIAHEAPFYHHHDQTQFLANDPVYLEKVRLIEQSGIAVFRFHDYWHRYRPDGIMEGLIEALEWQPHITENRPAAALAAVPAMTVKALAEYVKSKLNLSYVRVAGDLNMTCTRVGLLAGYRGGGGMAIPLYQDGVDVILAGEGPEWETPEYVRDAVQQGGRKALIMLGHAESEASGMRYLADRLAARFPDLPVHYLEEQPVFHSL